MLLTILVPLSILIPILFAVFTFKQANQGSKLLLYYLIASGLINLIALILIELKMRNLPLLHLYTIVEAVLILGYLRSIFIDIRIKKVIAIAMVVFPLLCVINFSFFQSIYTFNTYTRPLEAILITFFCMLYLYKSGFTENWINQPENWFNMGILLYFPVACVIFILSNYMVSTKLVAMNKVVWNVHGALVLIMYLFWAKGFSLLKKNG